MTIRNLHIRVWAQRASEANLILFTDVRQMIIESIAAMGRDATSDQVDEAATLVMQRL